MGNKAAQRTQKVQKSKVSLCVLLLVSWLSGTFAIGSSGSFSGPSGPFLQPENVFVSGRGVLVPHLAIQDQRRHGAVVHPAPNLGMAVSEREPPGAVVIARRQVI